MRFASLGSGSEGNGLLVEAGDTRVLIDCGFTVAETRTRLARAGVAPEMLSAIVVTHEHADHAGGVARFAAKYRIPVWLTFGTLTVLGERFAVLPHLNAINGGEQFAIGALHFESVPVPHDAREPVQFVCSDGQYRLGVLTPAVLGRELEQLQLRRATLFERQAKLDGLNQFPDPAIIRRSIQDYCQEAAGRMESYNEAERQRFLQMIIDRIVFEGERVTISLAIPIKPSPENLDEERIDKPGPIAERSLIRTGWHQPETLATNDSGMVARLAISSAPVARN